MASLGKVSMKRVWGVALAAGLVLGLAGEAFARFEEQQLLGKLSSLGMTELLEAHAGQLRDPKEKEYLLAQSLISQAQAGNLSFSRRDELLVQAAGLIDALRKESLVSGPPEELLEDYRLRLEWVDLMGLMRSRPYAHRLRYLQGSESDREKLAGHIRAVLPALDRLQREMQETLIAWRGDLKRLVAWVPKLEILQQQLSYKVAWIRFYEAISQPPGPTQNRLLGEAISGAQFFAEGDDRSGVKYWANLLMGMAARRQGQHGPAEQFLQGALGGESPSVKSEALFEQAANYIEWKRFAEAETAVGQFRRQSLNWLGSQELLPVNVKAAMLENYLYASWSEQANTPEEREKYSRLAQTVPLEFLAMYIDQPDLCEAFLQLFAVRYQNNTDYAGLNSAILLGLALRFQDSDASSDLTEKLLKTILQRSDEISLQLRPPALWYLGTWLMQRGYFGEAAVKFENLAGQYPGDRRAGQAIRQAVYGYARMQDQLKQEGQEISAENRFEFILALQKMLARADLDEQDRKRYFDLGWQYQQLSGDEKTDRMQLAIEAYAKVPAGSAESIEARYRQLALRMRILELRGEPSPQEKTDLLDAFTQYAREIQANPSSSPGANEWAAMAEFLAARLLYEQLNQPEPAMRRLRELPVSWPLTQAAAMAREYESAQLLRQRRALEAMEILQTLYRSDPQRAWPLLRGAMAQLQQQLFAMKPFASPEEVQPLREAFVLLAGQVYGGMEGQELSEQDRYLIRQGFAEALLIDGKPAEAMVLFQACQAEDLARRRSREEDLQREVAGHLAQLGSGTISRAYLPYRYRGFQEALQKAGLHEEALAEAADLKRAWDYWKQEDTDERAVVVSDCLRAAWKALERWQIAHLPVDGSNGLGLARAAQAMGDYPQALEYYRNLVRGIDVHELPEFYWKVQLERVGCLRQSLSQGGDRSQMEVLLRQLRLQDNSMGGFSEEFERIGTFDRPESH